MQNKMIPLEKLWKILEEHEVPYDRKTQQCIEENSVTVIHVNTKSKEETNNV